MNGNLFTVNTTAKTLNMKQHFVRSSSYDRIHCDIPLIEQLFRGRKMNSNK